MSGETANELQRTFVIVKGGAPPATLQAVKVLADGAGFVVLAEEARVLLPAEVQELLVLGMPQEFTQYVILFAKTTSAGLIYWLWCFVTVTA